MSLIITLLEYIKWIFFILITLSTFYLLFFSLAGLLRFKISLPTVLRQRKMAVFIPGYKEDDVIFDVAQNALKQDYPSEKYDVIVIADSFSPLTLEKLRTLPIKVIEVSFEVSSKSKALNKAMLSLPDEYEIAVVLDADNLMEKSFLTKINGAFELGFIAVQGHRTAKNLNSSFAILDAISEEINNHIFRRGHRVAGFSSALIGSGMAFKYEVFKKEMSTIESFGEDKELELNLLERKIRIEYLEDAYVFDEKIDKPGNLVRQRTRWISNQIMYAKSHFFKAFNQLFYKRNIDYFEKVLQHFQPPRILLGGLITLALLFSFIFNDRDLRYAWLAVFLIFVISMLLALPRKFMNFRTLKIVYLLPVGAFLMLRSLIGTRKKMKSFNATKHSVFIAHELNSKETEDGTHK